MKWRCVACKKDVLLGDENCKHCGSILGQEFKEKKIEVFSKRIVSAGKVLTWLNWGALLVVGGLNLLALSAGNYLIGWDYVRLVIAFGSLAILLMLAARLRDAASGQTKLYIQLITAVFIAFVIFAQVTGGVLLIFYVGYLFEIWGAIKRLYVLDPGISERRGRGLRPVGKDWIAIIVTAAVVVLLLAISYQNQQRFIE